MTENGKESCTSCGYPSGHSSSCEQHKKIIELERFLEEIDALDQQNNERTHATKCYARLKAKEHEFIGTELEKDYWNAVSLELFHMAQTDALQNSESENIQKYLKEALEAAKKGFSTEWSAYVQGTILYFENNTSALETMLDNSGDNRYVLSQLLNRIKERGTPNYKEDYLGLENT